MKASIFPDNTDRDDNSNQDDDDDNDDNERNVSETNSTSHHEDEDIDAWLRFFEEEDEIVEWDQENWNQEENFTPDTNYRSEDSFLVMNTQPSRSLRDILNSVTSYKAPDSGKICVKEKAESDIESDDFLRKNFGECFFDVEDETVEWDQKKSNQEDNFTQDTNFRSEDSFLVMNTQPSRSLRDILNSVTSYEAPDSGKIRVKENAESDIESDDLVDPNGVTSSSPSDHD